jgi:hypothetical protein
MPIPKKQGEHLENQLPKQQSSPLTPPLEEEEKDVETTLEEDEDIQVPSQQKSGPTGCPRGRPRNVQVDQLLETDNPPKISYTQAYRAVRDSRPKKERSEKQKAHFAKVVELNRIRRENEKLELQKQQELLQAKKKLVIVRPKRVFKKKQPKTPINQTEVEDDDDEEDAESTDTQQIKKKIKKLDKIAKALPIITEKREIGYNFFS